ncbi:OmpA family protein [Bdellovibrio sp. HCB-162]|uniref:OmpA family protein n=1 Tax=Bdellovibrio sp. HCB-162 TaxID=3394234 RepID=UPI0039BD77C9
MKIFRRFLVCFLAALTITSPAQANVLGNMQTFAPNPDSLVFQNIHSSQTLEKNYFNIGFFAAYVRNELSVYDNLVQKNFVDYKDKAFTFDLIFAWGVTRNLELTYSMPGYFSQEPDSGQSQQNFISEGINGHRLGFKYNISQEKTGGFAVAGSADLTTSVDNPYIGNSPAPIWNIEFIYDKKDRDSGYGFNLGYRKRTPGDPAATDYFLPVSDQLIASAGYVTGLTKKWRFHAELFSSYGLKKDYHPDQKYISSLEVLLGGKYRLARNLWGHFGATAEVMPKGLAPDYRVYLGINHFFGFSSKETTTTTVAKTSTLSVLPYELNLAQNEKQKITVSGGVAPYQYELSQGLGYFDETTMEYVAYDQVGDDEIIVKDAEGAVVTVPVHVRESNAAPNTSAEPLEINPSEITVYTGGVAHIKAKGGTPPYTADLSPEFFGSISSRTLKYMAPTHPGDVEVIVKDEQGQKAKALVHVVAIPKPAKALLLKNLNFIFNTSNLTKASQRELDKNLSSMSQVKIKKIIVVGHTDSIGSDEYNQELSQNRAETVAQILRRKFNLSEDQVEAVGYGETQPIATNETEQGRLTNRRVELKLYYNQ